MRIIRETETAVHLIVCLSDDAVFQLSFKFLMEDLRGVPKFRLLDEVWVVGGKLTASEWRDYLGSKDDGLSIAVFELSGRWAAKKAKPLGSFLKEIRDWF